MVDADHAERHTALVRVELDRYSGMGEGRVDLIDRDGVVRVGSVAADVADDAQLARSGRERFGLDEGRDLG